MKTKMKEKVKGKFYGDDPQTLQIIGDRIRNEFAPGCSVSTPLPTEKGDYHILVSIFTTTQNTSERRT
ncbi:MAG TPA: hypothetical protein VMW50_03300 [Dehalococcoidia bacterium]|nr:hypothetical protein [Dehalococcoidia bacterium]